MDKLLTPANIMFALGIIGIIFTIYDRFVNPQIKAEKKDALLEQKVVFEKEANEQRFKDMLSEISGVKTLAENHIHTVDTKVTDLAVRMSAMDKNVTAELVRLSTIIDERIPKKSL